MIEGPGHVPMHLIKENMRKQLEICNEAPFYTLGPLVTDIAPGYDHITSAIGAAMIGWYGTAMLCYVTPKEHLGPAQQEGRQGRRDRLQDRRARGRPRQGPSAGARTGTTCSRRRASSFAGRTSSISRSIPKRRASSTTRRCRRPGAKVAHFCSMCGPHFCSMKITQDVREYAETRDGREVARVCRAGRRGLRAGRALSVRPCAVLFDRDETIIVDVPFNGDPERVEPAPGARAARPAASGRIAARRRQQSERRRTGPDHARASRCGQPARRGTARPVRRLFRLPARARRRLRLPQAQAEADFRRCRALGVDPRAASSWATGRATSRRLATPARSRCRSRDPRTWRRRSSRILVLGAEAYERSSR